MSTRRAFTLFEALLAVALVVAISAGIFSFLFGVLSRRDRMVEAISRQAGVSALISHLENDLATTFAADGSGAPGVRGDDASLQVRSRAVGLGGELTLSDLQRTEYRFQGGVLSAKRGDGDAEALAVGLGRVRFRYFDGREWTGAFNSASGGLPVAVEVSVWYQPLENTEAGPAEPEPQDQGEGATADFGESAAEEAAMDSASSIEDDQLPLPDRVRIIVVPDGPGAAWKEPA